MALHHIACLDGLHDECRLAVQASVNLAMETALVRVLLLPTAVPEEVTGWRQLLRAAGERLAQVRQYLHAKGPARIRLHRHARWIWPVCAHSCMLCSMNMQVGVPAQWHAQCRFQALQALTDAGFTSRVRDGSSSATANSAVRAKVAERQQRLREATRRLALAWLLASTCLAGHLTHLWPAAPHFLHLLHKPAVAAATSALAMLGAVRLHCAFQYPDLQ